MSHPENDPAIRLRVGRLPIANGVGELLDRAEDDRSQSARLFHRALAETVSSPQLR